MSDDTARYVESIAGTFEKNRLANPYPSERSVLGAIITSMIETNIDPESAPIGDILRSIGGYANEQIDDILDPIVDRVNEGDISKDNVVQYRT